MSAKFDLATKNFYSASYAGVGSRGWYKCQQNLTWATKTFYSASYVGLVPGVGTTTKVCVRKV